MPDVVVLFGGPSPERKVSVASAQHVASVLEEAEAWFWAPDGGVHRVDRAALLAHEKAFENDFPAPGKPSFTSLEKALDNPDSRGSVFFLALHGTGGEDGTAQQLFEERRIAFTGPGAEASRKAMDKEWAKKLVSAAGVRIAQSIRLPRGDARAVREALLSFLRRQGRVVVKPVASGSSVGLYIVHSEADAERAVAGVAGAKEEYLAESFVQGTELTVAVVDGEKGSRPLPPTEVRVERGKSFDYDNKYIGSGAQEITPAEVPDQTTRAAQEAALAAHRALGCEGYSRTDIICDDRGAVFLEINTLPGLTRRSFVPQQLRAEGTSMRSFLDGQIALAKRRRDRR
jgi:D-alanine-D-alanine ligase